MTNSNQYVGPKKDNDFSLGEKRSYSKEELEKKGHCKIIITGVTNFGYDSVLFNIEIKTGQMIIEIDPNYSLHLKYYDTNNPYTEIDKHFTNTFTWSTCHIGLFAYSIGVSITNLFKYQSKQILPSYGNLMQGDLQPINIEQKIETVALYEDFNNIADYRIPCYGANNYGLNATGVVSKILKTYPDSPKGGYGFGDPLYYNNIDYQNAYAGNFINTPFLLAGDGRSIYDPRPIKMYKLSSSPQQIGLVTFQYKKDMTNNELLGSYDYKEYELEPQAKIVGYRRGNDNYEISNNTPIRHSILSQQEDSGWNIHSLSDYGTTILDHQELSTTYKIPLDCNHYSISDITNEQKVNFDVGTPELTNSSVDPIYESIILQRTQKRLAWNITNIATQQKNSVGISHNYSHLERLYGGFSGSIINLKYYDMDISTAIEAPLNNSITEKIEIAGDCSCSATSGTRQKPTCSLLHRTDVENRPVINDTAVVYDDEVDDSYKNYYGSSGPDHYQKDIQIGTNYFTLIGKIRPNKRGVIPSFLSLADGPSQIDGAVGFTNTTGVFNVHFTLNNPLTTHTGEQLVETGLGFRQGIQLSTKKNEYVNTGYGLKNEKENTDIIRGRSYKFGRKDQYQNETFLYNGRSSRGTLNHLFPSLSVPSSITYGLFGFQNKFTNNYAHNLVVGQQKEDIKSTYIGHISATSDNKLIIENKTATTRTLNVRGKTGDETQIITIPGHSTYLFDDIPYQLKYQNNEIFYKYGELLILD